jgi:hypothetical protein
MAYAQFANSPFNLPDPEEIIIENCTEADGCFSDKAIGLWNIADIKIFFIS